MSISFSGLASGLDTSSWVESLVALKQAKVETYEEEKTKIQTTQETLSKIKSFFTSFRTMLEKVTDAKFGVGSMDIFAQKLATSSDTSILTAAATTEAEEASYDITVDKLATGTQAVSGFKNLTTIIQSETATMDTKLSAIGVKAGDIGVTVNGTKHTVTIGENDTISNFITKMKNIGVDASYSEASGVFSINLSSGAIDDTLTKHADGSVGTGIVEALHLKATGGYESSDLKLTNTETIVAAATGGTKLSELGTIKSGNIQVKANNTSYNIAIDGNTTLASIINNLQSKGIEAKLTNDGVFQIKDAEIVDVDNTGIITALGLQMDVNSKTQTATGLKTVTVTTTEAAATGSTKISQLGTIKNGNVQVKANGSTYTIAIDQNTTLSGLVSTLTSKGVDASLSSDGVFTIKNVEIVDSGNTGLVSALGLTTNVSSKTQTSSALKTVKTITTEAAATGSTKISQLGTIKNGAIQVKANGSTYTITIDQNTTLSSFVSALTSKGVDASLSSDGTMTIKDAEIVDSGNTGILSALGLKSSVNSKTLTSTDLKNVTVTTTATSATGSTKISQLGTIKDGAIQVKANGSTYTITIDQNTTLSGLVSALTSKGVDASLSSDGVFTINNAEIVDSGNTGLVSALGLTTNVSSKTQTSSALKTVKTITTEAAATGSTKISQLGTIKNGAIQVKANDATYTYTIDQNTTLSGLMNFLAGKGVTATLDSDGNFSIANAGLFGYIRSEASVKNLKLDNANVICNPDETEIYAGALVGYMQGSISNCIVNSSINIGGTSNGMVYVGGLAGYANSTSISDVHTNSSIVINKNSISDYSNRNAYIGGIAGTAGRIYNSSAAGSINYETTETEYSRTIRVNVGGISGSAAVANSSASNSITVKGYSKQNNNKVNINAGGIVGLSSWTISSCYSTGNVSAITDKGDVNVGGLAGYGTGSITNSYSLGNISAKSDYGAAFAGGISGYASYNYISYCYSMGSVIAETTQVNNSYAGGIIGRSEYYNELSFSFTKGKATATTNAGGIIGSLDRTICVSATYYNSDVISNALGLGESGSFVNGTAYGIASSKFTQDNITTIGFNDANGWVYNSDTGLAQQKLFLGIDMQTTLAEVLGTGCANQTVVVNTSSGEKTVIITATDSIYTKLQEAGLNVTITDNQFTIKPANKTTTIASISQQLSDALNLVGKEAESVNAGGGLQAVDLTSKEAVCYTEYYTYQSNGTIYGGYRTLNIHRTSGVSIGSLMYGSTDGTINYITIMNEGSTTVLEVNNATIIRDFFDALEAEGIKVYTNGGIVTFSGDSSHYITGMTSGLRVALRMDSGVGYTVTQSGSDSGSGSGSGSGSTSILTSVFVNSSSSSLALSVVGVNSTNYITVKNGDTTSTVTITGSTTVKQLAAALAGVGITTDVTNGKFTFSGDNTHYILGMTTNLKSALNLVESGGKGYTIQTVQTSSTQTVTLTSADTSIKLGALGLTGTNFITVQKGNTTATVIVDTTSTLTDMTNALAQCGISTNISDGKITFSGDSSHYIVGISSNLASALKLSSGSGKTYTTTVTSTNTTQTLTVSGSNSTVNLSAIGATKTNYITVKNGTTTTVITLTTNSTIANMTSALTAAGIDVDVTNGIFTFTGDNTHYILGMSANLANILNFGAGTGGGYVTTVENTYSNTNSNALKNNSYNSENNTLFTETTTTQTIGATRDTLLSSLGVTAGEFYIYKDGVKNLAVVSSDETLGSFLDKLSAMGIQAGLINNGTSSSLILNAQGDTYIAASEASGASNILTQLFDGQTAKGNVSYQGKENVKSTSTQTVAADREGLLSAYGVTAGELYVYQNGERHTVQISSDETIGSLIDTLAGYGLKAELVKNGNSSKIVLSGSGDSYIAKSNNASGASNIVDTLFGGSSAVVNESSYTGVESITTRVTATIGATESTALSSLGVTAGEYYIYNNGVKYTALISSEETLGSFMNTLKSFGIQTGLINNGNATNLLLIGSGNSYVAKSNSVSNASNVVEKLFGNSGTSTSYSYTGSELLYSTVTHTSTATTDSLLSEFDTPWGGTTLKSAGDLVVMVNGETKTVRITETETFGSLVDKLKGAGIQSDFLNGKLYITNAGDLSVIADRTTSALFNPNSNLKLTSKSVLNGFMSSTATVQSTTTIVEEHSASASAYADMDTKLSTLGITSGSLSVYRNGEKALINVESSHTLGDIRSLISQKFSNVDMKFDDNGKLVFYSTDKDVFVELGNTTDTSNFLAVTGVVKTKDGTAESARALYTVNGDSKVMSDGIFRRGKVTAGTFVVGTERIEINANTTINDLVSMINNAAGANATAYWDTIDGKLVIKSRSSGAALINIEAGTSNFTDIMGYTTSEWNADGSLKVSRMNVDTQELGSNAQFRINGTSYTATSNTITSDITRIKGVTLNLNGLTSGSAIKVTVEKDKESVATALSDIVDSYNELMSNVDEAIAKEGALKNQMTLKMIRNQLRSFMTSSDLGATTFRNLSAIGISVESASASNISTSNSSIISLNFDKDKFFKAYEADADAVKALLIGGKYNKGIFTNVETLVDNALQSVSGYFAITESAYNRELTNWNTKITKANKEIDRYKSRLEKKFSSMDLTISQMQQQYSSFLS